MPTSAPPRFLTLLGALPLLFHASSTPAEIFDFEDMVLLAHVDDFPKYTDLWGFVGNDGREYLCVNATTATVWYDVDDPENPVEVAQIGAIPSGWRDTYIMGDHAYVVSENFINGIQIIDISTPSAPFLAASYTTTVFNAHNIFGDPSRNLLFVVGATSTMTNGGVIILDATNPTSLVEIGRWDNKYVHDLTVEGNILHAALVNDDRYRMIDITDPTMPVNYGSNFNDPTGSVHATWPLGDGVHVAITHETVGGHLKILDYSNPNAIGLVGTLNPAPSESAHNPHLVGDRLFVSWYRRGTRVIDVSDPGTPTEIGYFDTSNNQGSTYGGNWGVYPHLPSGIVASTDRQNGLFILRYDEDAGTLAGNVFSSQGGFLEGATVHYADLGITQVTGPTGAYKFSAFPGASHTIQVSAYGFQPKDTIVSLSADGTTNTNITLTALPTGPLSGTITDDGTALPLADAEVSIADTGLEASTDSSGTYSFPAVVQGDVSLHVQRPGFASRTVAVSVGAAAATEDVALSPAPVYVDFSNPVGWSTAGNATGGLWVFDEPHATYATGIEFQPDLDHTPGADDQCAITGNLVGANVHQDDVDGGATILLSPVYDLSAMSEPHVYYYHWYAVNDDDDDWVVEVSEDGSSWVELARRTDPTFAWVSADHDLTGLLGSYSTVQFRFTAQDQPTPSGQLTEAVLDDFTLYDAAGGAVDVPILLPGGAGRELALGQSHPNPFSRETSIRFALPAAGPVDLSVFDVRGARIATLVHGALGEGEHLATWDGRSLDGGRAAPGVYFYKLHTEHGQRVKKMVRIR